MVWAHAGNASPFLSHPSEAAADPRLSHWWSGYSNCVCLFVLNDNNTSFINSAQTAAGQTAASPADTQQPHCRLQKPNTETFHSKHFSPAHVVLLEALWWPSDCCLCSTSLPRQAAAEGLHDNMPRHSVCISIVTWCNKCWSQFTKHLCQFATWFGLVFKAFLLH